MEELYNANAKANAFTSSSSGGGGDHRSLDDISLFLNQILNRSSLYSSVSSPVTAFSSSFAAPLESYPDSHGSTIVKEGIYCLDTGINVGNFSGNVRGNGGGNTTSFSIGGVSENETDEYDCESEEGLEAFVEDVPAKPAATRSSSKRSRAAEVHNLSEKRRRSRINEKMKALQNLIPNSNKTDKASMLDEAIEYLKQLQLQVQMLSMRNGISLHPACLPRLLQPIQQSQFNRSQQMNILDSVPLSQGNAEQTLFELPNRSTVSNQLPLPTMSTILNSETSLGIGSSIRSHFNPFPLPATSLDMGGKSSSPYQLLNTDHSARIPPEVDVTKATMSRPFETQADGSSLGAWMTGRDQSECVFSKNVERSCVVYSTSLQGTQAGSSAAVMKLR